MLLGIISSIQDDRSRRKLRLVCRSQLLRVKLQSKLLSRKKDGLVSVDNLEIILLLTRDGYNLFISDYVTDTESIAIKQSRLQKSMNCS